MYGFFTNASDEIINNIDSDNLSKTIEEMFLIDGSKLEIKLKKIIKAPTKFRVLAKDLNIEIEDLLFLLVKIYPMMFNHRLIKFIRKEYLFPEQIEDEV